MRWSGWLGVVGLAGVMAACGGSKAGPGTPGSGAPSQDITGHAFTTTVTSLGRSQSPTDLSETLIQAQEPSGTTFVLHPGLGRPDGTFTIPGGPAGDYWLKVGSSYFWTRGTDLDLDQVVHGRTDAAAAGTPTAVDIQVGGLVPWLTDRHWIQWVVPNQAYSIPLQPFAAGPWVASGAAAADLPVAWQGLQLPEAAKGDQAYLLQFDNAPLGEGWVWTSLAAVGTVPGLTLQDGAARSFPATLAAPPALVFDLDWRRAAFEALAPQVHPSAVPYQQSVTLLAEPFGLADGWVTGALSVARLPAPAPDAVDALFRGLRAGNPYPSDWLLTQTSHGFVAPVQPPAPGGLFGILALVGRVDKGAPAGPLAPTLSPLRNLLIDGADATQPRAGLAESPLLQWSAPALGQVHGVWIQVAEAYTVGSTGAWQVLANLYASGTAQARIPPFLLKAGHSYFFRLRAYQMPGLDFAKAPNARFLPYAFADAVTAVMQR